MANPFCNRKASDFDKLGNPGNETFLVLLSFNL